MSEGDATGSRSDTDQELVEPLGGGTVTIPVSELEATVERVIRRLGVQARSDDGAAEAAAASDSGRRTDGLTLPAASTPVTSTTSSGAGAGKKTYCTGSKTL